MERYMYRFRMEVCSQHLARVPAFSKGPSS
jgi:hypothetical protein